MMADVHDHLARAITADGGEGAVLLDGRCRPWASATFAGHRHRLRLSLPPERADAFIAALPERDFALPRHFVADILVTRRDDMADAAVIEMEALTVEA